MIRRAAGNCDRFIAGDGPRSAEKLLALIPSDVKVDYYGNGGAVTELEEEIATRLGKPAALFLPTGVMAQQATLRVHADRRGRPNVAFHPLCHLESHEERAYQRLHGLFGVPVGSRYEPITMADLEEVKDPLAALLIELPQRDLGGTLPRWNELEAQVAWARDRGAAVHLDGARLWEAAPYYARTSRKSIVDICALFDTVYVSFYKGLGAIAGCCVAGEKDVIDELSLWRTRQGGRAFMLWPYAASALTAVRERADQMPKYYRRAQQIGAALADVRGLDVIPTVVQSPLMHLRIHSSIADIQTRAVAIAQKQKVLMPMRPFDSEGPKMQRFEFQVGSATMAFTVPDVVNLFRQLAGQSRIR
jgi:threonine aldolase